MHISLVAILEGIHISLVICVWGYTYHGDTDITVTGPGLGAKMQTSNVPSLLARN